MYYKTCEICGLKCGRTDGNKRFFMSRFPLEPVRCKQWVKATGKEDLIYVPIEKLHQLKFVCGKHFRPKDFSKSKAHLKRTAIPTLELPAKPLPDYRLLEFPLRIFKDDVTNSGRKRHQTDNDDSWGNVLLEHNYVKLPTEHEPPSANEIGTVTQNNPEKHNICLRTQGESRKPSHDIKNNPLSAEIEHSDTEFPDCDYSVINEDDSVPFGQDDCAESQIYVKTQSYELTSAFKKVPLSRKPEPDNDDPLGEDQLCDSNVSMTAENETKSSSNIESSLAQIKLQRKVVNVGKSQKPRLTLVLEPLKPANRGVNLNPVIRQKVRNNNVSTHPSIEVPLPTTKRIVQDELNAANTRILNLARQNVIKDDLIKDLQIALAEKESKMAQKEAKIKNLQDQIEAMETHISIIEPKLKKYEKSVASNIYKRLQKRNLLLKSKLTKKAIFNKLTKDLNAPARTFIEMQCLQNKKKDKGKRYTLQGKILGLSIYKASPTVYKLLSKYFILPSVRSLQQFTLQLKGETTSSNCTVAANDSELNTGHCGDDPDNSEVSPNKETENTNNSHKEVFQFENCIFNERLTPQNNEPQTMQISGPTTLHLHDGLTVPIEEGQAIELVEGIAVELGNGRLIMLSKGQLVEFGDEDIIKCYDDQMAEVGDWQNNQDENQTTNPVHSGKKRKETEINPPSTFEDSEGLIETHTIKKRKESHSPVVTRGQDMPDLTGLGDVCDFR